MKEAKDKGEEYTPPVEEEKAEEPVEEEVEEPDEEEVEETPPKVSLDEEEKKIKFRKLPMPDLTPNTMSKSFADFTLPEKAEGFDEIRHLWKEKEASNQYLKQWILQHKTTTRIEELIPSPWFNTQWSKWQNLCKEWNQKASAYKQAAAKKEADKRAKALKKQQAAAKSEADRKKKEIEAQKAKDAGKEVKVDETLADEPAQKVEDEEDEEEELVDFDDIDIFGLEDVCDIGGGMPLFKDFMADDWAMLSLRFELSLLTHAFRRDANDPERTGIYIEHLAFYYQKYFKKELNPKAYGVTTSEDVVGLVLDTVQITKGQVPVLQTIIPEELESFAIFAKITEEDRRYRGLMVDSGDDSSKLKLQHLGGANNRQGNAGKLQQNNAGRGGDKWQQQNKDNWGGDSYGSWKPIGLQGGDKLGAMMAGMLGQLGGQLGGKGGGKSGPYMKWGK